MEKPEIIASNTPEEPQEQAVRPLESLGDLVTWIGDIQKQVDWLKELTAQNESGLRARVIKQIHLLCDWNEKQNTCFSTHAVIEQVRANTETIKNCMLNLGLGVNVEHHSGTITVEHGDTLLGASEEWLLAELKKGARRR